MNILIILLVAVVTFIAFLLIMTLFIKKEHALEREIIIDKPRQQVFNYIKYLKNQDNFSKWVRTDPNMKKELEVQTVPLVLFMGVTVRIKTQERENRK